jgi:hypothetical protein
MTSAAQHLHEVLLESMRLNGDEISDPANIPPARKATMSSIDPQEFGELKARVEALLKADDEKTQLLRDLSDNVNAMRLQMAEARGGWKVLMLLGGASASLGGVVTWALTHFTGKGAP